MSKDGYFVQDYSNEEKMRQFMDERKKKKNEDKAMLSYYKNFVEESLPQERAKRKLSKWIPAKD